MSANTTARLGYSVLGEMRLGDDSPPTFETAQAVLRKTTSALVEATRRCATLADEVTNAQTMVDAAQAHAAETEGVL